MRGTRVYLDPKWIFGMPITAKANHYSFGIRLLRATEFELQRAVEQVVLSNLGRDSIYLNFFLTIIT